MPFACPADWTPPQPAEVRAMLAKAGLSQVKASRDLGMSRSAVAKWLSGKTRIGWPTWRVLVALADERG